MWAQKRIHAVYMLACENIRFSSLFAAGDVTHMLNTKKYPLFN